MIEAFFEHPYHLCFLRSHATGGHVDAFAAWLVAEGYGRKSGRDLLRGVGSGRSRRTLCSSTSDNSLRAQDRGTLVPTLDAQRDRYCSLDTDRLRRSWEARQRCGHDRSRCLGFGRGHQPPAYRSGRVV